ncbi:MAG: TetR/AcrR family transcriptional regulator [Lachnospiraceae bacterium]|nr:TetR/AcrR family transcriptional regulator [Lachnospiraceae bacterium]
MEKKEKVRQVRAAETRRKIVAAAKKLITEKGFESVAIEDIAREAGVSTGSFYTYFKKKEDVIEELNRSNFLLLAKTVNEIRDKDLNERLKYYCREFLAEIERVGIEICRQWIRNNITPTEMEIEGKMTTKYDHDYLAMRSILDEGIKRGELSDDTPIDDLALYINAQLYGLMIAWCMTEGKMIGSKQTDSFVEKIVKPVLMPYSRR